MTNVVFVSNGVNTHVLPLFQAFLKHPDIVFTFLACDEEQAYSAKRVSLTPEEEKHLVFYHRDPQKGQSLIEGADFLILGMADPALLKKAAKEGKIIFHYSEHFSKNKKLMALRYLHNHFLFRTISNNRGYLLAASAFAGQDFAKAHLYRGRNLFWGYFPKGNCGVDLSSKTYSLGSPLKVLYSGRLLDWKHPEMALRAAETLFEAKIPFEVTIIGEGEMMETLKSSLKDKPYSNSVSLLGYQDNAKALKAMADANVFLFPSDRGEGWGAVLNEAMSSQCAVLASGKAGSTGFLVNDGENGFTFSDDDEFQDKLLRLAQEEGLANRLGLAAKATIEKTWNATIAVNNLLSVYACLSQKQKIPDTLIEQGPGTFIR